MPREFSLAEYKAALAKAVSKNALKGWQHLVNRGVPESKVFEAVRFAVSSEAEDLRKAWQGTRLTAADVRALGRQLQKYADPLQKVIVQYPELLPSSVGVFLPLDPQMIQRNRLEVRLIPTILRGIADKLLDCRGKSSDGGNATVRRPRTAREPGVTGGIDLLNMFQTAEAGIDMPSIGSILTRERGSAAPFPQAPKEVSGYAPYAYAAEMLNLACRLAKTREVFTADSLRKAQFERSPQKLPTSSANPSKSTKK